MVVQVVVVVLLQLVVGLVLQGWHLRLVRGMMAELVGLTLLMLVVAVVEPRLLVLMLQEQLLVLEAMAYLAP